MSTKMSANFTLEELIQSDQATRKGIDNTPSPEVLANLGVLALGLERVRSILQRPMHISSGYRCPKLNASIGGAKDSYHLRGLAADFTCPEFGTPREIAEALVHQKEAIGFYKLIWEGTWVHIQFPDVGDNTLGEVLTATFVNGKAQYSKGLA